MVSMPQNKATILVVEDEQSTLEFISAILYSDGYHVIRAASGKKAISMTADNPVDVILLDLGLPDIDGMKVLKSIREWSDIPIIIVSARDNELDKVAALDAGAYDYITKPFGNNELLARIRTAIFLYKKTLSPHTNIPDSFSVGDVTIHYHKRTVTKNAQHIHLTPIEYKIVVLLSQNAGKVLTHEFIIGRVWGLYEKDDQLLRVNMANIRRKLENSPANPQYILTEVGVGYRMAEYI